MSRYVYEMPPIDHDWERLETVEEAAARIAATEAKALLVHPDAYDGMELKEFLARWQDAQNHAVGWDGDFRGSPRVFWLPVESTFVCAFVFKQDNNGTTYVVSPVELPHLAEWAVSE